MKIDTILFDMDGVLVDVSQSYRMAIKKTSEFFTDQKVNFSEIADFKQRGGYNNDWKLTKDLIRTRGFMVDLTNVINKFQEYYLGKNFNGLIMNEKWLMKQEILQTITRKYKTGIVTGRPRIEAEHVMERFSVRPFFDSLVAMEDTPPGRGKPAPDGILQILKTLSTNSAIYLGDTVDDIKAACAAHIIPVGVLCDDGNKEVVKDRLQQSGATLVIDDVNQIMEILE